MDGYKDENKAFRANAMIKNKPEVILESCLVPHSWIPKYISTSAI